MRSLRSILMILVALGLGVSSSGQESTPDSGLVEETGERLGQLDVTVTGPEEEITTLNRDDFELVINGKFLESFLVDRVCSATAPAAPVPTPVPTSTIETVTAAAPLPIPSTRPTYLFYFDQHHLNMGGRTNSIEMTRSLVQDLVRDGARGMIVSAGGELETLVPLTEDRDLLQDGLDRLDKDLTHWSQFAYQEDDRVDEVQRILNDDFDTSRALGVARQYQREERWRTDKALRLFEMTLVRLADLDPPKSVVYFADSMRKNAGAHYVSYFPKAAGDEDRTVESMSSDGFVAGNAFQRVVETAASHGVRLYTVHAEGMVAASGITGTRSRQGAASRPDSNARRRLDAQDSLVGLARETGGQAFLHGAPAKKIAKTIQTDMGCVYLISFPIDGLPLDAPLPVTLRMKRPKVKVRSRGQIVLASAEKQKTSRLLAAFTGMQPDAGDLSISGIAVPTGFVDGAYTALIQVLVPPSPLTGARWEIGASLVANDRVRSDVSGQVGVDFPDIPVVFEAEMRIPPGPFELVMVAHEGRTGQVASTRVESDWPDPGDGPITLAPLVLLQPADGAFLRGEQIRRSGPVGMMPAQFIRPDKPTAVVGVVCRDKGKKRDRFRVERTLTGDSSAEFVPLELSGSGDRCIQLRDIIRAGTMTEGRFTYEVRVVDEDDAEVAASSVEFSAVEPAESAAPAGL